MIGVELECIDMMTFTNMEIAICLLTEAPADVSNMQLRELNIRVCKQFRKELV